MNFFNIRAKNDCVDEGRHAALSEYQSLDDSDDFL
jgi:hypothetical protein